MTRRWMRTLPLYLLWIVLLCAFLPYDRASPADVLRYATLTQNLIRPMPDDHWFAVSWSLTVEEWFYLLFGSAVILSAISLRGRAAVWLPIAIFILVPTVIRCTLPTSDALFIDMRRVALLRLDAIAYGAAMVTLSTFHPRLLRRSTLLFCGGVVVVSASWWNLAGYVVPWHMAGSFMLTFGSLGLALCLPLAVRLESGPRWFESVVRTISAQSYGLYIMHLTFLDLAFWAKGQWPDIGWPIFIVGSLLAPFVLSWLSFRYFESPILHLRPPQAAIGNRASSGLPLPEGVVAARTRPR